jgi:hypothetical protein
MPRAELDFVLIWTKLQAWTGSDECPVFRVQTIVRVSFLRAAGVLPAFQDRTARFKSVAIKR